MSPERAASSSIAIEPPISKREEPQSRASAWIHRILPLSVDIILSRAMRQDPAPII
jgi:hypothetical protein